METGHIGSSGSIRSNGTPSHTSSTSRTSSTHSAELEQGMGALTVVSSSTCKAAEAKQTRTITPTMTTSATTPKQHPTGTLPAPTTAASATSTTTTTTTASGAKTNGCNTIKKRISSSRAPAAKARRIRFYRNGDRFYAGIVIAVSTERYRSFEALAEDLTRLMEDRVSGAVRNIYTTAGKRIAGLDDIEDGTDYVCLCNKETFKKCDYTTQPNKPANNSSSSSSNNSSTHNNSANNNTTANNATANTSNSVASNRLSRHLRSGSPALLNGALLLSSTTTPSNGSSNSSTNVPPTNVTKPTAESVTESPAAPPSDAGVRPRIVTIIRSGTKPRRMHRLLLNKRIAPTFEHALVAITECVKLDSGCVRKVYRLGGTPVQQLADFFDDETDAFLAYGTERVQPDDFRLNIEEAMFVWKAHRFHPILKNEAPPQGLKKLPPRTGKNTINLHNVTYDAAQIEATLAQADAHDEEVNGSARAAKRVTSAVAASAASTPAATPAASVDFEDDEDADSELELQHQELDQQQMQHVHLADKYTEADLPASIRDRYQMDRVIGDGNFAVVMLMQERQTAAPYALKIIEKSKCRGKEHYIEAEVRVMKKLNHPHIMGMVMDVDTPVHMFLVLEYVSGGDLFDAITRVTRFSESRARLMIRHLVSATAYLHALGIVHRDIKPENLLVELDADGQVTELKLADFGLACEVTEPLLAVCGTPTYVAPEILLETGYGLKIDVWAAGIILYILLCGFPPFVAADNQQEPLFDAILSGIYEYPEPYWNDIGNDVRDLIGNMLQSDPLLRFSSEEVLEHHWTTADTEEQLEYEARPYESS